MAAHSHGMAGISISGLKRHYDLAGELILRLRRGAMECGLLITVEGELSDGAGYSEYADFAVMTLDRTWDGCDGSFADFEGEKIRSASEGRDVSNMLLDLPAFGISGGEFIGREQIFDLACTRGSVIEHNDDSMTVSVKRKDRLTATESTANVMERIRLAVEGGFLGFSVDLLRVPFYELYALYCMTGRPMNLPVGGGDLNCRGKE